MCANEKKLFVEVVVADFLVKIPIDMIEERIRLMLFGSFDEAVEDIEKKASAYFQYYPLKNKNEGDFLNYLNKELDSFRPSQEIHGEMDILENF